MPIKKSAFLLLLVSACSISLLVFSSGITPPEKELPVVPNQCLQTKCRIQKNDVRTFSPWDMISQIVLGSAA